MSYKDEYNYWLSSDYFDEATRAELRGLTDEKEIEDRFYKGLEFGTGGLRGVMGAGSNRMNYILCARLRRDLQTIYQRQVWRDHLL